MIISNLGSNYSSKLVKAKVELYYGSTLIETCTCSKNEGTGNGAGALSHFDVSREGELGKFFGFGISHKLEMTLIDLNKALSVYEGYTAKVCLGDGTTFDCPYPNLEITSVKVDKKTGDISVTAYDALHNASKYKYEDLTLTRNITVKQLAEACGRVLGLEVDIGANTGFSLILTNHNYIGDETVRDILNHIAEVTQTIYFINYEGKLVFKKLTMDSVAEYSKKDYYDFAVETPKTLTGICSATELGDNVEASSGEGVTQFVRSNPIWVLRDDIGTLLDQALARVDGLTLQQFELDWTGDYKLEVGDCITVTFDDDVTKVHILCDTLSYSGTMDEVTEWSYEVKDSETPTNPTTIGDKINQTFAKVDKVNKEVNILVSDVAQTKENVASLTMTTDTINLTVQEHEKKIEAFEEIETGQIVDRMAQIELELDGITATVSENAQIVSGLSTEIDGLQTTVDALELADTAIVTDIETNTSAIATLSVSIDGIKTSVTKNSNSIGTINTEIDGIKGDIETNTEDIGKLEVTTQSINAVVENHTSNITNLQNADSTMSKNISSNADKIGKLEVTTNNINATVSNNTSKITTITNKNTEQDGKITTLTNTTSEHTSQIATLNVLYDNVTISVNNHNTQITELQSDNTQNKEAVNGINQEITTIKQTQETTTDKLGKLEVSLDGIDATVSSQTSKISTLETTTTTISDSISSIEEDISGVNESIDGLQGDISDVNESIGGLQDSIDGVSSDVSDVVDRLDDEIVPNLSDTMSNVETLTTTVEEHTSQIADLQVTTNGISASVTSQQTKIETLESSTEGLLTQTEENTTKIGELEIKNDEITTTVSNVQELTSTSLENFTDELTRIENEVSTKVTAEDVVISIKNEIDNGIEKVTTSTGYTFDEVGLTVEKSGKEMKTQITEDGMTVYRDETAVLTANNTGVDAKNLKASTYLVIGTNSRFENYGTNRTACFWIGG